MGKKHGHMLAIVVVLVFGCTQSREAELMSKVAKFPLGIDTHSNKAARVGFDLVGTWRVTCFDSGLTDTWQFDKLPDQRVHRWEAKQNRGIFTLTDGDKKHAQALLWGGRAFVICEHSFGFLQMLDAETGERFMAVRNDGPQGDDAVFIKYRE